jgi:hypothetical protein
MEESLVDQIIYVFVMESAQDADHAIELVKIAYNEGDIFMLPKDEEIKKIFDSWAKSVGLEETQRIAETMFDSYNEAIDDVLDLMKRLKSTNKDVLIKKIEKLKKE